MKKQTSTLFSSLSKKDLVSITATVKETIAFNAIVPQERIFTAADLWNIQRNSRHRSTRKFL